MKICFKLLPQILVGFDTSPTKKMYKKDALSLITGQKLLTSKAGMEVINMKLKTYCLAEASTDKLLVR